MNIPAWMIALGFNEKCIENLSSAEEKGRKFSIQPKKGDRIWRVKIDGCYIKGAQKRVDYLFWGQSNSNRHLVILVELKGSDFGTALKQIESTLSKLCKTSPDNQIHGLAKIDVPNHEPVSSGGVKAIVVLSKGKGVPQRFYDRERIRKKYGIQIFQHEKEFRMQGLDNL